MRLPVILVQNPPASGAALAEALVGNLIGRAGLDLTLVDRFDALAADSTDRMTLEAITVPSAILDWQSESEMLSSLSAIGFLGTRCAHQLDSAAPAGQFAPTGQGRSNRRLFLFDLNRHRDAAKIIAELDRLRSSLSIKTFSLGAIAPPGDASAPLVQPRDAVNPGDSIAATAATPARVTSTASMIGLTRSDENLDALIDQLDDLDV